MVMPTTKIVLSMVVDIPVMPISWMSQLTNGSEKLSAANAEERNPARVMATWMAERKLSGARIKASSLPAVLSPSSACFGKRNDSDLSCRKEGIDSDQYNQNQYLG